MFQTLLGRIWRVFTVKCETYFEMPCGFSCAICINLHHHQSCTIHHHPFILDLTFWATWVMWITLGCHAIRRSSIWPAAMPVMWSPVNQQLQLHRPPRCSLRSRGSRGTAAMTRWWWSVLWSRRHRRYRRYRPRSSPLLSAAGEWLRPSHPRWNRPRWRKHGWKWKVPTAGCQHVPTQFGFERFERCWTNIANVEQCWGMINQTCSILCQECCCCWIRTQSCTWNLFRTFQDFLLAPCSALQCPAGDGEWLYPAWPKGRRTGEVRHRALRHGSTADLEPEAQGFVMAMASHPTKIWISAEFRITFHHISAYFYHLSSTHFKLYFVTQLATW